MADTIRTRTALIAFLADNASGDITAQSARDVLVSLLGVYGSMRTASGAAAQGSIGTTPVKVTGFTANGFNSGITPDHTNDRLTVGTGADGTMRVTCAMSVSAPTASALFRYEVYKNGVTATGLRAQIMTDAAGSAFHLVIDGLLTAVAADFFEIFVVSDNTGRTMTATEWEFTMERVG